MLPFHQTRYNKLGPVVVENLKKRHFDAWYYEETQDAVAQFFALIPPEHSIGWGGSLTLEGLDIFAEIKKRSYTTIDRDSAKSPEERQDLQRRALTADTFVGGVNALSQDGALVNIDGMGNRVAAYIYGPKQVVLLVGMNKVAKTVEDAIVRARTLAAPLNMQRFSTLKTPCSLTGACENCKSPDSICSFITITRLCKPAGRIKVILVGKDLGL